MRLIEATELFETERHEAENGQSNLIYVKDLGLKLITEQNREK
jgi:hypothetical protein